MYSVIGFLITSLQLHTSFGTYRILCILNSHFTIAGNAITQKKNKNVSIAINIFLFIWGYFFEFIKIFFYFIRCFSSKFLFSLSVIVKSLKTFFMRQTSAMEVVFSSSSIFCSCHHLQVHRRHIHTAISSCQNEHRARFSFDTSG